MIWLSLFVAFTIILATVTSYYYPWWRRTLSYQHPRILCYHMIEDRPRSAGAPRLAVSPANFERQVRYLQQTGWRFVTMSELLAAPSQEKTVALTFDDGYQDNLTRALPILERYDAKATVYVIDNRRDPLTGGGYPDGQPFAPLMTDEELKRLSTSSCIEIGAHTISHRNLTETEAPVVQAELTGGKTILESLLNLPIRSFAYPYSAWSPALIPALKCAGYDHAVIGAGICTDLETERFHIRRLRMSGTDTFRNFLMKLRTGRKR